MKIVIGTRKSLLARIQAEGVAQCFKKMFPKDEFMLKGITTSGDRLKLWGPQAGKGMFVKEIETALLEGKIDLAVHSMKDLPVNIPEALEIAAVTKRLNPQDVLISLHQEKLRQLRPGSCIGTFSPRRKMQLLAYRPDLKVVDIRGNLDSRLRKLKEGRYAAIVVAAAGVLRLGLHNEIGEFIPLKIMLPAPGQGALGIEIRKNEKKLKSMIAGLNHEKSLLEVTAERAFLKEMGGGCRAPIAALGKIKGNLLRLEGCWADNAGGKIVRSSVISKKDFPDKAGIMLAKKIACL